MHKHPVEKRSVRVEEDGSILFGGRRYKAPLQSFCYPKLLGKKGKYVWVVALPEANALMVWDHEDVQFGQVYRDDYAGLYDPSQQIELPATNEDGDVVTICVPVSALDRWWSALDAGEKAEIFSSHMSYLDALEAPAQTAVRG